MSDRPAPAVTISLVTWNGLRWLPGCLGTVAAQTLADYELLIIDNGSTDGSVEWLREHASLDDRITLLESGSNLGFARAHNRNIAAARGSAVLLLNQDVELDPGFLAAALTAFDGRPEVGSVQARLRRLDADGERSDVLDTTGLGMHRDRRVVSRGQLLVDDPMSRIAGPVWGVDGAVPVYRSAALESARLPRTSGGAEVLDEDFFSYKEDVDLAWRLRRLGWEAWYEPAALAWHARGGGDTGATGWRAVIQANMSNPPHVRALSWRNHRLMQLKNEEPRAFLQDLPWIARRELQAWAFMLVADPRRLGAVPELLRGLPAARRKRRALVAKLSGASGSGSIARGAALPTRLASRLRVTNLGRATAHMRRRGVRATLERVADELREQLWVARHGSDAVGGIQQSEPRAISARLDRPRFDGYEGSPFLGLLGWAYAKAGVASVEVYLDGRQVGEATVGRARPDVTSAWKHLDEAEIEGFSAVIGLDGVAPGARLISVVIHDGAGHVRILSRRFRRLDAVAEYQRIAERADAAGASRETRPPGGRTSAGQAVHLIVFDRDDGDLRATLRSIARQGAQSWRCVIVAAEASTERALAIARESLKSVADSRWSVTTDSSQALRETVDPSALVGFLRAGETLVPFALAELSDAAGVEVGLVYADHDAVDRDGTRRDPWFLPDWSPGRLLAQDYIQGAFLVRDGTELRAALARATSDVGSDAWRYGLLLEVGILVGEVRKVPRVLWSRPTTDVRDAEAEADAVRAELERRGGPPLEIVDRDGRSGPTRSIVHAMPSARPTVSIIVPTTGRRELVADLLDLLGEWTAYEPKEIVVLDNSRGRNSDGIELLKDAGVELVECDEPFNWARLSNRGAAHASGDLLLFLNDDMHTDDRGWLEPLVQLALQPDVGAVGPLLVYPDGTIQHAGIFLVGHGGGAAHLLQGLDPTQDLYLDLQHVTREVSAVTGACLLVRREAFDEVGGFDERFRVSGNDVDFCLRLNASGRRVLWAPQSVLLHEEGRSRRGVDYLGDEGRLWERWGDELASGDPYHSLNLSQDRVDCDLDWSRLFGQR